MYTLLKVLIFCFLSHLVYSDDPIWGASSNDDTSIRSFIIENDEDIIEDLKCRLNLRRRFTPPLINSTFTYGFNTGQLDSWLDYWAKNYSFSDRLPVLNQFPQYKTVIQGLDLHFIRVSPNVSSDVEVVPLLLLHGWPGSFKEFLTVIPLITDPNFANYGFAVEVIVPSLPGFGFSEGTTIQGLGATEMATVLKNLMNRLGYEKFYVQGGDWGSFIGSMMATLYPDVVLGYHTNFPLSLSPLTFGIWFAGAASTSLVADANVTERLYPLTTIFKGLMYETGYLHIQSTKPDTIGVAMSDSPAGLLAYILQLFSMASRNTNDYKENGGLDLYSRDDLLDDLMIYWITNSFTTSIRIYAETFNMRNVENGTFALPTPVPTWSAHTKSEMIYQSPVMLKVKFTNLLGSTVFDDYGHFFALEQPEVFTKEVLAALDTFRKWHNNTCSS